MDLLTLLLSTGAVSALIAAVSIVTQVVLNKKLRTPADRTAEVNTVLQFFKDGIADSREDRRALEETTKDLREYISRLERNSREDFALRVKLEERIADLERRIRDKDERIAFLENELTRYASMFGTVSDDLEDTDRL